MQSSKLGILLWLKEWCVSSVKWSLCIFWCLLTARATRSENLVMFNVLRRENFLQLRIESTTLWLYWLITNLKEQMFKGCIFLKKMDFTWNQPRVEVFQQPRPKTYKLGQLSGDLWNSPKQQNKIITTFRNTSAQETQNFFGNLPVGRLFPEPQQTKLCSFLLISSEKSKFCWFWVGNVLALLPRSSFYPATGITKTQQTNMKLGN